MFHLFVLFLRGKKKRQLTGNNKRRFIVDSFRVRISNSGHASLSHALSITEFIRDSSMDNLCRRRNLVIRFLLFFLFQEINSFIGYVYLKIILRLNGDLIILGK